MHTQQDNTYTHILVKGEGKGNGKDSGPQAAYICLQCGAIKLPVSFSMQSLLWPKNVVRPKNATKSGAKFHTDTRTQKRNMRARKKCRKKDEI